MFAIETIRKERPQTIKVRHGAKGRVERAEIRGWLRDFPLVCYGDKLQYEVEVSVETLVTLLNADRPLVIL